jgi:hypothetical protein
MDGEMSGSVPHDQEPASAPPAVSGKISSMDPGREEKPACRVCGLHIEMPTRGVRYSDSLGHWCHIGTPEGVAADRDHEALR